MRAKDILRTIILVSIGIVIGVAIGQLIIAVIL